MANSDRCPKCGAELEYDEVDIGVGVMRGNPGCPECFWTPDQATKQYLDIEDEREGDGEDSGD